MLPLFRFLCFAFRHEIEVEPRRRYRIKRSSRLESISSSSEWQTSLWCDMARVSYVYVRMAIVSFMKKVNWLWHEMLVCCRPPTLSHSLATSRWKMPKRRAAHNSHTVCGSSLKFNRVWHIENSYTYVWYIYSADFAVYIVYRLRGKKINRKREEWKRGGRIAEFGEIDFSILARNRMYT